MDYYQEIKLLPDPEFTSPVLMNALYGKLHRALAGLGNRNIGVSFPGWQQERPTLGDRLRLHGHAADLQRLMKTGCLTGMHDHIITTDMAKIPVTAQYCIVRRVQAKSNPERLRRRLARRKGISIEEARQMIPDNVAKHLSLPFVTIRSQSTGQIFRLFIEHDLPQLLPAPGEFNYYGLSSTATVPWF